MKHNKYSKLKIPKCIVCGEDMILDDIDYNFDGNQDNYFMCRNDYTQCCQKIRFGIVIKEEYQKSVKEND